MADRTIKEGVMDPTESEGTDINTRSKDIGHVGITQAEVDNKKEALPTIRATERIMGLIPANFIRALQVDHRQD